MTTLTVTKPVKMGKSKLTLGANDVTAPVSGVTCTPSTSTPWKGIGGNRIINPPDWTIAIAAVQDTDPAGFLRYAMDHYGEASTFRIEPEAGGPALVGTLTIGAPSQIGGSATATTSDEFTLSCEVNGQPDWDDTPGA